MIPNKTMDGELYQIFDKYGYIFGIYWCEKEVNEDILAEAFRNWEESDNYKVDNFEDWWNSGTSNVYIHRVYLNQIYI